MDELGLTWFDDVIDLVVAHELVTLVSYVVEVWSERGVLNSGQLRQFCRSPREHCGGSSGCLIRGGWRRQLRIQIGVFVWCIASHTMVDWANFDVFGFVTLQSTGLCISLFGFTDDWSDSRWQNLHCEFLADDSGSPLMEMSTMEDKPTKIIVKIQSSGSNTMLKSKRLYIELYVINYKGLPYIGRQSGTQLWIFVMSILH